MAQMRDEAYRADMPGTALPPQSATILNWIGAALSLALLIGVCAWGYRLMVRDVSGVPVVQALAGPMRISPDDPGGRRAAHQGLAVGLPGDEHGFRRVVKQIDIMRHARRRQYFIEGGATGDIAFAA